MRRVMRSTSILVVFVLGFAVTAVDAGNQYALVIGINEYEMLGRLDCARADAEALAKVLVQNCGFDPDRLCLITDDPDRGREFQPTFTNLQRRLQYFTSAPVVGDTVLIYFAGHGITLSGEGYLMPADGSDERSAIAMGWLREQLNACKASRKVLILDACHSGKLTRGVSGIAPALATAENVLILASSKENQISYPDAGHGVFTAALLAGLEGKADRDRDMRITGAELYAFVRDYMDKWSIRTAKVQTPQIMPSDASGICIATVTPRPAPVSVPTGIGAPTATPTAVGPTPELLLASLYKRVAHDLVCGDVAAANRRTANAKADGSLNEKSKELSDLGTQMARITALPELIMGSFSGDTGREVKVELRSGTESMLIESVAGCNVTAKRIVRASSGWIQATCNFGYQDLSYREKERRLAALVVGTDTRVLAGMLALNHGQKEQARKLFGGSSTSLGKALAERLRPEEPQQEGAAIKEVPAPPLRKEPPAIRSKTTLGKKGNVELPLSEFHTIMKAKNPNYTGAAVPKIAKGRIIELVMSSCNCPDLSPLQGLPLQSLNCERNHISDLTPLQNMPLVELNLAYNAVTDLTPLKGMPLKTLTLLGSTDLTSVDQLTGMKLTSLNVMGTGVADLSPLRGMPLECLGIDQTPVSDLTPLQGMKLREFSCKSTKITDLSPLRNLPLESLDCSGNDIRGLVALRGLRLKGLGVSGMDLAEDDLAVLMKLPLEHLVFSPGRVKGNIDVLRRHTSIKMILQDDRHLYECRWSHDPAETADGFWKSWDGTARQRRP